MSRYSSYILYLLIAILVVSLYVNDFGPLHSLQQSLDDMLVAWTAPDGRRPNVAMVEIDARAQDTFGEWPWAYDLVADLTAATATAEPRAVVLDFDLPEDGRQDSAGYTDILAGQLLWIDNAVLQYDIALASYRIGKTTAPPELFRNSIATNSPVGLMEEDATLQVRKVFLPADELLADKPYLGFDYEEPDDDRTLRRQPLVMNYEGYYYPSQPLLAAAVYLGVEPDQIKIVADQEIQVGSRSVPIGERSNYYVRFNDRNAYKAYSAADVLAEGFDLSQLKDKLVIIAVDDPSVQESFVTTAGPVTPASTIEATIAENIINNNMIRDRTGVNMLEMIALFLLGAICAAMLPMVSLTNRFVILGVLLILVANYNYFMVASYGVIPQTIYFALEIFLFMLAAPVLDSQLITGEKPSAKGKKKPAGPTLPEKSIEEQLAEAPVREVRTSPDDPENIDTRAMSASDKTRQMAAKASSDATQASDLSDSQESPANEHPQDHQSIDIDAAVAQGEESTAGDDPFGENRPLDDKPMAISDSGDLPQGADDAVDKDFEAADSFSVDTSSEKAEDPDREAMENWSATDSDGLRRGGENIKNLGRYQVTGVLGKGAMGMVYRGIDPAINRPVALKTIRLDFVNDPEEMAELKERLHREAQAAGKLSHPNIVTIYDVGEENQLQYIAMEYLEGRTLEDMIKKKVRFNYRIIAQIITQICMALDYAHEQGIVHRDIKPANIMILSDYRVKVMDYGIARIDSNSMTKTGIAMGTPNYISPEQLKGLPIDRRADIFSLGVVMYEMLIGKRPFRGENITALIYSITTQEPDKPSNVNPQIPLLFDHIIDKALRKVPDERYQKASEISSALQDFVEAFSSR